MTRSVLHQLCEFTAIESLLQGEKEIPDYEIHEIAKEIEESGRLAELRDELEEEGADLDARTLLSRWQKEMVSMDTPSRPCLLYHLERIGKNHLHSKLVCQALLLCQALR